MKSTSIAVVVALVASLTACHRERPTRTVGRVPEEPLVLGPEGTPPGAPVPIGQTSITSGDMVSGDMVGGGALTGAQGPLSASSGRDGDLEISRLVRERLQGVDTISGGAPADIEVTTSGGTVMLRGVVSSEAERDAVGAAASRVPGVLSVDNRVDVARTR